MLLGRIHQLLVREEGFRLPYLISQKRTWPSLEWLTTTLEISCGFTHDPTLKGYTRVDKNFHSCCLI